MKTSRFILMSITVLLTIMLSAVMTVPALADDSVPPAETSTQEVTPPDPVVDSVPGDSAATDPAPADSAVADPAPIAEPSTLPELIEQLPENTTVVVTDASGEAVPLVTEAAAQTISNGDPIWCPLGVAPKDNTGGCSPSFKGFTDTTSSGGDTGLIAWLTNGLNSGAVSKAGTIWIASSSLSVGSYSSTNETPVTTSLTKSINIDGNTVAGTMETFSLTIQGGWNGTPLSMGLYTDPTTGLVAPSVFDKPFAITGWAGAVTIKNVEFNNVNITAGNTPTTGDYALKVQTTGNITLDTVTVVDSQNINSNNMGGAALDNTLPTHAGLGTITVNNGVFNGNDGDGLVIQSDNTVTTKNLIANGNGGIGVLIDNDNNTTLAPDKSVSMTGFKQFNGNGYEGLKIISKGLITLSNLTAEHNGVTSASPGVSIDNTGSSLKQGVTITGTSYFVDNTGDGLSVKSYGAITVYNLNAFDNDGNGVSLDNCGKTTLSGKFVCNTNAAPRAVLINGSSNLLWNHADGLNVLSAGTITTYSLTADQNTSNGVTLDNSLNTTGSYGISMYGTNYFTGNVTGHGLAIYSHGVITTTNLNASFNGANGAMIDNCNDINDGNGDLTTCGRLVATGRSVTLSGTNSFNGNNVGLEVYSYGAIAVYNVTASNNDVGRGAYLVNNTTATLNSVLTYSTGTIGIYGYGTFFNNQTDGFRAESNYLMYLYNLTANSNKSDGVYLRSVHPTLTGGVYIYGTNVFNNNNSDGLSIETDGGVLAYNLTGNFNQGQGVWIDNTTLASTPATVLLYGYVNVNQNDEEGLFIDSRGAITIYNISAYNNGNCGVDIFTSCTAYDGARIMNDNNNASPQSVYIYGTNTFINNGLNSGLNGTANGGNGLTVLSYGLISLANATANNNGAAGLVLDNHSAVYGETSPGSHIYVYGIYGVTVTGYARVTGNVEEGLYIDTRGAVSLTNVYAFNNGSGTVSTKFDGVKIINNYPGYLLETRTTLNLTDVVPNAQNVTISGLNTFSHNGQNGLYVYSYGTISVSNVTAVLNDKNGAVLDNCRTGCAQMAPVGGRTITVSGLNTFYGNAYNGLVFDASSLVYLYNINADFNNNILANPQSAGYSNGRGISGTSVGNMSIYCAHVYGNNGAGYNLTALPTTVASTVYFYGLHDRGNNLGAADPNTVSPKKIVSINLACP
jgi:hypothetical protein